MFKPEDFELSLEQQLKIRVVNDDIDSCTDIDALRKNLKEVTTLLVRYQKILKPELCRYLDKEVAHLIGETKNDKIDEE